MTSQYRCGIQVLALALGLLSPSRGEAQVAIQSFAVPGQTAGIWQLTKGPDGAIWFTLSRCDDSDPNCSTSLRREAIIRITTDGEMTEFPLPFTSDPYGAGPYGITAGPDGALWFAEVRGDVGRMTTDGELTFYPLPPVSSAGTENGPYTVTTGPDGAVWFTRPNAHRIGRISTTGEVTEFPIPSHLGSPLVITVGSDGALWFTVSNGIDSNSIVRMTTSGTLSAYPLSSPCAPSSITAGPDAALWFTCGVGAIGRITVLGVVKIYGVPTGAPGQIANGGDGALWFTEPHSGLIGRITTSGVVAEYVWGLNARPITSDEDSVWFGGSGYIGRIPRTQVNSLTLAKETVTGCRKTTALVTLTLPALPGGLVVTLESSNAHALVKPSIKFQEGATSKSVAIVTSPVASIESATITATAGGKTASATLTLMPMGVQRLTLSPNPVVGGYPVDGTVMLECPAGPGPITVDLNSTQPTVASPTTATVTVPFGSTSAPFGVSTTPVTKVSKPTITGTANGVTKSKTLVVNPGS